MRVKKALLCRLELPEEIVQELRSKWEDVPRAALESVALEAYRSHALTAAQLRRLLGFETRMQVDAFLKAHEVYDFTRQTSSRIVRRCVRFGQERLSAEPALADNRRRRHVADQLPHPDQEH
jgi:hypothetical protein